MLFERVQDHLQQVLNYSEEQLDVKLLEVVDRRVTGMWAWEAASMAGPRSTAMSPRLLPHKYTY